MNLVLASGSPRRRELLAALGLRFEVEPPDVEEQRRNGESPATYVERLAREKGDAVAGRRPEAWVISADTIVEIDGAILEKPRDRDDAARMLAKIAGRSHIVHTGVTLQHRASGWSETRVAATRVTMLPLDDDEIRWYVATGEPLDKAGSYGAQGIGGTFIDSIEGSYTNVVGLPMALVYQMLKEAGHQPLAPGRTD